MLDEATQRSPLHSTELSMPEEPMEANHERIYMLNALWFEGREGAAHYGEYAAAAAPFVEKYGGRLVAGYRPDLALIGEWDPDLFFVVEWPSWEAFQRLPQDPGSQRVAPLRERGLRKSLLIRCRAAAVELPR